MCCMLLEIFQAIRKRLLMDGATWRCLETALPTVWSELGTGLIDKLLVNFFGRRLERYLTGISTMIESMAVRGSARKQW